MNHAQHNTIVNFIWGVADDVLRDVYIRGKYRDVILPMTVIRRLDCLLEPAKEEVLKCKKLLDEAGIVNQEVALRTASGQAFYNTSEFTLRPEVQPHVPDVWIDEAKTVIGYEIPFPRYFYQPQLLCTLKEIRADIEALERETKGILHSILLEAGEN